MRKTLYLLFLAVLVISCSSDAESDMGPEENEPVLARGTQAFQIDFKEITTETSSQKNPLEPAFAILSISDAGGNVSYTREKFALLKEGENYVTEDIGLEAGGYSLIEFIVTDANDVVIALAPIGSSILSQFTETSLPLSFTVVADQKNISSTENIEADGFTAVDFGYGELSLVFPESTDFFSLTVDETTEITTKTLNLKSITGSTYLVDWGDGTIEEYVSTIRDSGIENEISHTYAENGEYTINVSGAVEAIEVLSFIGEVPGQVYQFQTNLVAIDVSKLVLLKDLSIFTGKLTDVDLSGNTALENLTIRRNALTNINLSNHPNLKEVFVDYNQLSAIDLSQNSNLENLNVTSNQLSNLDLSNQPKLQVLNAWENQLTSIDLSNNTALRLVNLSHNALMTLDISQNTNLLELIAGDNQISSLDVSSNPELRRIDIYQNQISSIDVSANLNLNGLYIDDNQLSTVDLTNNTKLEYLTIENNMLSELNLASNPKIFNVHIGANQFSAATLDTVITQIYDHAIANSTADGYIDYQNNPGFADIDPATIVRLNELASSYNWTFNNN